MNLPLALATLSFLKLVISLPPSNANDLNVFPSETENSRGRILLMFQGCGVKTSLFKLGLRLGHELRSEGYDVTLVTTLQADQYGAELDNDQEMRGFSRLDIQSEEVIDECKTLKGKVSAMSTNKVIGTQQLLGLLRSQRIGCEALLQDSATMDQLRALRLDMIISESFNPCHVILSQILGGIPIANFHVVSPSSLPFAMFPQSMDFNQESFLQRLQTIPEMISLHLFYQRLWGWYSEVANNHDISVLGSVSEFALSYANASIWFLNGDLVLDYPLTLPPNFIFLGDLTSHPPRPIADQELRETISQFHPKGHIIVSINTIARQLGGRTEETLVSGLSRLPFHTLWRNERPTLQTSATDNIHYTGWMEENDMNDLLGVNGTVAFITTGGRCGILESIYHGVPIMCLPLMSSDHHENCAKVERIGMGVVLDIHSFTADDVYDALMKLAHNESFRKNALHASHTFKSRPQSKGERVAFWVKHVLQNGDRHLKQIGTGSFFSLIQYTCLDILVQIVGIMVVSTLLCFKMTKWIFWQAR